MRTKTLFVVCAVLAAAPAFADIIYDNGGPNVSLGGTSSDAGQGTNATDSFVLAPGDNIIRDVHWWGGYDPEQFGPDDFLLAVFDDDGGLPDADGSFTLLSGSIARSSTGLTNVDGFDIYRYDMILDTEVALTPNTTYWLAIINFTDSWFWQHSNVDGDHVQGIADGGILLELDHDLAFQLTDGPIIPEPASMALLGIGLTGLVFRHKRRT